MRWLDGITDSMDVRRRRAQPKKGVISLGGEERDGELDFSAGMMDCCQLGHFCDFL